MKNEKKKMKKINNKRVLKSFVEQVQPEKDKRFRRSSSKSSIFKRKKWRKFPISSKQKKDAFERKLFDERLKK